MTINIKSLYVSGMWGMFYQLNRKQSSERDQKIVWGKNQTNIAAAMSLLDLQHPPGDPCLVDSTQSVLCNKSGMQAESLESSAASLPKQSLKVATTSEVKCFKDRRLSYSATLNHC